MRPTRSPLLLAATLLFAASTGCRAPVKPRDVQLLASATLADLTAGAVTQACARIYEPSDWDAERIAADRKQMAEGFDAMMKEVGTLSDARMIHNWLIYEVGVVGGDPRFWQSLPNQGIANRVVYTVNFSRMGPGIVSLTFTHLSGKWELRSIAFGVERSMSNAREKAGRMGRALFRTMNPAASDEQLDQMVAQVIGPERH